MKSYQARVHLCTFAIGLLYAPSSVLSLCLLGFSTWSEPRNNLDFSVHLSPNLNRDGWLEVQKYLLRVLVFVSSLFPDLLCLQAIRLYQNCLKKFHGGRDPSLHIYLAHAFFDARQYSECMSTLLKALHVSPNNLQLWYNLALTRETFAVAVLQKEQKGEARTLAEVENAIEDLKVRKCA